VAEKTFERTPKDLIIGIAMTLCGGVLWGVNATVSKILMGTYHASPLWIACVRELAAGVLFLTCSAIMTPKLLTGALRGSQIIFAAAGHRHHMRAAGAGRLPRIDQLDQLRHRDRAAKPEPAVRLGGRMPALAGNARRTERDRRVACLPGNRAYWDRRRFSPAETPLVGLIWGVIKGGPQAARGVFPGKLI